ncbi:hypothetical protein AWV80_25735 [Cupriavidus sp. UYMU48A]|nr:hypothetical protein AWV80_25735 [Cupriavidus sp. UYMU48A]
MRRRILEVHTQQLLLVRKHAQLDRRIDAGVAMQEGLDLARREQRFDGAAGSSSPTTPSMPTCAPSAAELRATLAAPPRRSSLRLIWTTGTGLRRMRSTSPNQ